TFTARFGTARPGGAPIEHAYLLINSALNPAVACYVEYTVLTNTFRLLNDAGNTWTGSLTPGVSGTSSNSECTLSALNASATTTIPTSALSELDLVIPLSFSNTFAGSKNLFMLAVNDSQALNSGWEAKGSWNISNPGQVGVDTITPLSGAGTSGTF